MSQKELILKHMRERGTITPLEALNRYGCFRCAARIADLRAEGHNIRAEIVGRGKKSRYASYSLVREMQESLF